MARCWQLYVLLLPAMIFIILFRYGPMFGLTLAFKSYNFKLGILGSPWVGLKHFQKFFTYYRFGEIFRNTVFLSFYKLIASFPLPIILAISLNELTNIRMKKILQTVTYAPYFVSVVIVVGIMYQLFSPHYGIITEALRFLGYEAKDVMSSPSSFRHIFVWTDVWQLTGYSAILYIATLSSVSPELYEAAQVDGVNKLQKIVHIDFPSLAPTAIILLILEIGRIMDLSFEKVILLQTPLNLRTSEVLTTYIYKAGLLDGKFDYATAGTLFNSVINFALVYSVNSAARRMGETSLW